jgi:ketosteroid isomerase-like protein
MTTKAEAAADALGSAIRARNANQILAIYADDVAVFHGSTGQSMGKAENAGLLAGVFAITSELEYINIKRHAIESGLVQQHRLTGKFSDGKDLPGLEACLVIKVNEAGKIASIDEYFDGSIFAEVWERLAALQPAE